MDIDLFTPLALGRITLHNRLVMAAMTRDRAEPGDVPGPLSATYEAQRASAGLIVTEGSQVSPQGKGRRRRRRHDRRRACLCERNERPLLADPNFRFGSMD